MEGKVKWFSSDKGYGFVTDSEGVDRFVHADEVVSRSLIEGESVSFSPSSTERGPRAERVRPLDREASPDAVQKASSSVQCPSCQHMMRPQLITRQAQWSLAKERVPVRSICPFCGVTYREFTFDGKPMPTQAEQDELAAWSDHRGDGGRSDQDGLEAIERDHEHESPPVPPLVVGGVLLAVAGLILGTAIVSG